MESRPGTDPDRASFTTILEAARDELTAARGVCPSADPLGVIGRAMLGSLLSARRPRYSARKVKCATSRYLKPRRRSPQYPDHHRHRRAHPPLDLAPRPRRNQGSFQTPLPPTRRQLVTAIMSIDPHRGWTSRKLADKLQVKPHNLLTQLAEWTRLGFLDFALIGLGGIWDVAHREDPKSVDWTSELKRLIKVRNVIAHGDYGKLKTLVSWTETLLGLYQNWSGDLDNFVDVLDRIVAIWLEGFLGLKRPW